MRISRLKKVQVILLTLVLMIILGFEGLVDVKVFATEPATTTIAQTLEIVNVEKGKVIRAILGQKYTLTVLANPEIPADKQIIWSSSNNNRATVEDGIVTFQSTGRVTITARYGTASTTVSFDIVKPILNLELKDRTVDLIMEPGDIENLYLDLDVNPNDATNIDKITWRSSNSSVATVDKDGVVTAKAGGVAYIHAETLETVDGYLMRVTRKVIVHQPVTDLKLESEAISIKKGSVVFLKDTIKPDDATDKGLIWSSSDENVVIVDQNGKITALDSGHAIISVKTLDGSERIAETVVTVLEPVTGISLNARSRTVEVGSKYTIIPLITPSNADNKKVTYTSIDPSVASVDASGVVTGVKGGTTLVVVKTEDRGLIASMTIEVKESVDALSFEEREAYIGIGLSKTLEVIFNPGDVTDKRLKWSSNNTSMVTVDQNGKISGISPGTAMITVEARDGSEQRASIIVHSVNPITGLIMGDTKVKLREGDTKQLTVNFLPSNATVKEVKWNTSDPAVAKVDNFGVITAISEGECKITASSLDGGNAYAETKVTVVKAVTAETLTVHSADTTMLIGDSRTFIANIRPAKTTESFSWLSTDTSIATVDGNGKVTAVGSGVCDIVAISELAGVEDRTSVKVVALNTTSVRLEQYDTYDLFIDGVKNGITWYSRNPRVATVNQNGKVTAREAGTTTIIARLDGKRVTCEITVDKMKK